MEDRRPARMRPLVIAASAALTLALTLAPAALADPPSQTGAPPTITGPAFDGAVLSADPGGWDGDPAPTFDIIWLRCDAVGASCAAIGGASSATYTAVADDIGHTLRLRVEASNDIGTITADSAPTATIAPAPPAPSAPPSVRGNLAEGEALTADLGDWTGTAPITTTFLTWLRCDADGTACAPIADATSTAYVAVPEDVDHLLRIRVRASNVAGTRTVDIDAPALVADRTPHNVTAPSIEGDPTDGQLLAANPGGWTGAQPLRTWYSWQRCAADGGGCRLTGVTTSTYQLTANDIGRRIALTVRGRNAHGEESVTTALTAVIASRPPAIVTAPRLEVPDGAAQEVPEETTATAAVMPGTKVTATADLWTGSRGLTYAILWYRCALDGESCSPIDGATERTYTVTDFDAGATVRVEITATNPGGLTRSLSPPVMVLRRPLPPTRPPRLPAPDDVEPRADDVVSPLCSALRTREAPVFRPCARSTTARPGL